RRGRQRGVVEGAEDLPDRAAQVLTRDATGGLGWEGWHLVEEAEAGVGQGPREQPGRAGDQLAELDERGAQELEGMHQPLRELGGPRPAPSDHHAGEGANEDE